VALVNESEIRNRFQYHAPKGDQQERYVTARDMGYGLAEYFTHHSLPSRELSLALTKLEEAIMWFNAGIARNE